MERASDWRFGVRGLGAALRACKEVGRERGAADEEGGRVWR